MKYATLINGSKHKSCAGRQFPNDNTFLALSNIMKNTILNNLKETVRYANFIFILFGQWKRMSITLL